MKGIEKSDEKKKEITLDTKKKIKKRRKGFEIREREKKAIEHSGTRNWTKQKREMKNLIKRRKKENKRKRKKIEQKTRNT